MSDRQIRAVEVRISIAMIAGAVGDMHGWHAGFVIAGALLLICSALGAWQDL